MIIGLVLFGLAVGLLLRLPVAIALVIPSMTYLALADGVNLGVATQQVTSGLDSFPLLAVPLFILVGHAANEVGVADRLYKFAQDLVGHVRGGLAYVNVLVSFGFSWMSGAALADAAGIGTLEIPQMTEHGYDEEFAIGATASSAVIGPIMPPSIPAVVYAVIAGVSVGSLFIAAVIPAFLITLCLASYICFYVRNKPELKLPRASLTGVLRSARGAALPAVTPVIILGGVLIGIVTPTEAAGIAAAYMILLGLVYKTLRIRSFYRILRATAETTSAILFIFAAASLYSWVLTREQAPQQLGALVTTYVDNRVAFLLVLNVLLLVLGMVLDPGSALLIIVPVLLPVAEQFSVDPVQLGVIIVFNLMIGLLTPPVGLILYVMTSITRAPFATVVRGVTPFLVPLVIALLLITFVPAITLWLPETLGF